MTKSLRKNILFLFFIFFIQLKKEKYTLHNIARFVGVSSDEYFTVRCSLNVVNDAMIRMVIVLAAASMDETINHIGIWDRGWSDRYELTPQVVYYL